MRVPFPQPSGAPRFISFEGVDGSGKSTQARRLSGHLRGLGVDVVDVREPGGTPAAERMRALLLDPEAALTARAEALLFAAARAELVERVIEPALERGATVIADRFVDSSLVYQGLVRALGAERVRGVNELATGGRVPDRTVLLEIDREEAARRRSDRCLDRIETEPESFQAAVADGYEALAEADPQRIVRVDARGDADAVAARVREALGV